MWQTIQTVLSAIGAVVVGGGAITALSMWLFKTFTAKWLDSRFAHELEEFRHKHQTELQRLKLEIDALLDRTIKLHGREFETLPQAWSLLNDAFRSVLSTSIQFFQHADLEHMTEAQLEEFLQAEDLPNWKKDELRRLPNKNEVYFNALQWKGLNQANKARSEFHDYILKNGIFFPENIRVRFLAINNMMISAFVERQVSLQSPRGQQKYDEAVKLSEEGKTLVEQLQSVIHDRLWSSTDQGDE